MDHRKTLLPPRTVYHGTDAHFEQFDVERCLGAHFGTFEAASQRLRDTGRQRVWYTPYEDDEGSWIVREETRSSSSAFEHGPFDGLGAAEAFIASMPTKREPLAFEIDIYKPLLLDDLGTWEFQGVLRAVAQALPHVELDHIGRAWNDSSQAGWQALKQELEAQGFDSVAYVNQTEDVGNMSWIVLRAERIHHRWRAPVASPVHALDRAQAARQRSYA